MGKIIGIDLGTTNTVVAYTDVEKNDDSEIKISQHVAIRCVRRCAPAKERTRGGRFNSFSDSGRPA